MREHQACGSGTDDADTGTNGWCGHFRLLDYSVTTTKGVVVLLTVPPQLGATKRTFTQRKTNLRQYLHRGG